MKKNKHIKISFYPSGYNSLDVFVDDFWSVEIDYKNAKVKYFTSKKSTEQNDVLKDAKRVFALLKEVSR